MTTPIHGKAKLAKRKMVLVGNAISGGGLAVAKSLSAAGYRVITADLDGAWRRWRLPSSGNHYWLAAENQREFENGLLDLVDRVRPDVFLPLGNHFTFTASKNRDRIGQVSEVNVPPLESFLAAYHKGVCMDECRRLGIPCPAIYSPDQALEMLREDRDAVLVVKPDCDWGAAVGVSYVRNGDELRAAVRECGVRFGGALIEEYVPGGVDAHRSVVLLFSPQSHLIAAFTERKIRQWPQTGGLIAIARSTADEDLVKLALPIFEKWRWCGGAEVELKRDSRSGQDKVIEINPRFPGNLRFPIECGLDLAVLAANPVGCRRAVAKAPFPSWPSLPAYTAGVEYFNPGLVVRVLLAQFRSGELRGAALRKGVREMWGAASAMPRLLRERLPWPDRALARCQLDSSTPPLFEILMREPDVLCQQRPA